MADWFSERDSEGVYSGMSLEEFGIRVSPPGVATMPKNSLREAIDHLRGELASGDPLSPEERQRLDRVLVEVSGMIDPEPSEPSEPKEDGAFVDELRGFAERFEESHPELAVIVGRIMDSLSQLGF
jgi:hypothetical protein